jgi:hypothetical protein
MQDIEDKVTLVMTASVDPKGMPAAATVAEPNRREVDYLGTLRYYIASHPRVRRIVFAENSGWPLDRLREAATDNPLGKDIEFLSFRLNDFPREYGKGYGELLLLDHVIESSRHLRNTRYFAKITGRQYLLNLTRLLSTTPKSFEFCADLRDHPFYEWMRNGYCGRHGDARFFISTTQFYREHFLNQYSTVDEGNGIMLENLIYRVVKSTLGRDVCGRFRVEPDYRGIAGHLNKNYGGSRERAKRLVRAGVRRLAPWLWI